MNTNKDEKKLNHIEITLEALKKHVMLKKNIPKGHENRVLEIGCGLNETFKKHFIDELQSLYIGIDKQRFDTKGIIKADMHNLPFNSSIFNIVFSSHVFEHSDNPIQLFKEINRVMTSRGLLIFSTPNCCYEQMFLIDETHLFVLNIDQFKKILEYCGFNVLHSSIETGNNEEPEKWSQFIIAEKIQTK